MAKKLLLADDSVTIQKVVGISFANEDVELVTVDNGDDAIARARELHPDVVLADVVMPGKNGYEVCEALKTDPELAQVPVLLLTGTFEAFDDERAQRCGAAGHVAKPFEAQALVDRVRELMASPPPAPVLSVDAGATVAIGTIGEEPTGAKLTAAEPSGEGFDFFEEALADMPAPTPAPVAAPIDIDPSDGAFAFAEDDMVAPPATPVPEAMGFNGDGTVEMPNAPQAEPAATLLDPAFAGDFEAAGDDPLAAIIADDPAADSADAFDFAVAGGEGPDPLDIAVGDDLAQETVLDPHGASGYDVSSSDLGIPLAIEPEPVSDFAASPDLPPPADLPPALPPEPDTAAALFAPAEASPAGPALIDESALEDLASLEASASLEAEPVPPSDSVDPNEASEPGYAAFAEPRQHRGETTHDSSALAGMALAEIEPRLRENVHDTLEKVAWESLGGVAEEIVRQAVERIERAAWEVIPQMAETLIREEIRRMKGE